ncbi:MAG: Lrp/AsnC family transcriptional regulator [Caldimicrobium sp.]
MKKEYQELLNLIQEEFPLEERPFAALGKKVGLTEQEVINFFNELKEKRILRHLGASPDSSKLGHFTCLCACHLPKEKIPLAEEIANLPEVTHAYLRDHFLNFWFTIVLPDKNELENYLKKLQEKYAIEIKAFPALKKFKVKAIFLLET